MYRKLKEKLDKLFAKNTKKDKYEEILVKFNRKLKKLKTKNDSGSQEEVEIIKKLIIRIEENKKNE